jgi:PIN domain nuclease of toxin-antitoxin system
MRLLLDTHIFLWLISDDVSLSDGFRRAIVDSDNEVYLSVVSVWEVTVKHQLGKLTLPENPSLYLPRQRERHQIMSLVMDELSVARLSELESLHRDPFDRMLLCQALAHDLLLVTVDSAIQQYANAPLLRI